MFRTINPEELNDNLFKMIGRDWLLVTAEKDGKANTMTASWGGAGIMWGKPSAFVFIRPQRFTKEFVDGSQEFSLTVLGSSHREILNYCGTVSGRDEDKIVKCGLTLAHEGKTPYFEEGNIVLICRKLFAQELAENSFLDKSIIEKWYPQRDYHTMYVAEIEKVLIKE
ncbi:flavin reductase family protein [Lachnospiraceae bacterium NSJ-143]|nr:flavin reductase family protein [Lachnospiraceae bacterium NSJ-143]